MLLTWVWDRPCKSRRAPSRPTMIRRIDLAFSDEQGRRLLTVNNIGQGSETPTCGDRGRPSVLVAWP